MVKRKALLIGIVLLILLGVRLSSGICDQRNTPQIKPINYFELLEDELFEYDFNLSNMPEQGVSYAYALLDKQLTGISISSSGVMRFKPSSDDVGVSQVAVIAVKESCADTLIVTFKIFSRPEIVFFEPKNSSFNINQTRGIVFRVRAVDRDVNDSLIYTWFVDSKRVNDSFNKTTFTFRPGFGLSGVHAVTATVTDLYGLSENKTWYVQISKINRPPVLLFQIPGFMIFENTEAVAYNLNDYFRDPDEGILQFEYRQVNPAFELPGVAYANVSVNIDETGSVTYNPMNNTYGYVYFVFTAYDILNASAESNIAKVDVISSDKFKDLESTSTKDYCGDYFCSVVETCSNCPFDCGECQDNESMGCKPDWNCTEWTPCMPAGFMTRNCTDLADCKDNRTKPDDILQCEYTAKCDDGLKNGIEEGVDCGGPCEPCPTCDDGIQNQGEDGIDCGGPCELCPSCFDGVRNQNESDVDCGGPNCPGCDGNKSCLKNKDCKSLRCEFLKCTSPSCSDGIMNQDEQGIDCEGPCPNACGNCSDGLQNRGEEGVDCGGRCPPCPTCSDGIRNGNEWLTDCGGDCGGCSFKNYFKSFFVLFIILFIIIGLIPLFFIGYFFFLLVNPEKARRLYENNTIFSFLVELNRFFAKSRKLRKKSPAISEENAKRFISELSDLKYDVADKILYEHIIRIFTAVLGLPEEFDDNIFNLKLRASAIPLFMKILFAGYFKKADILPLATFVAPEQKQDMIVELKFLLTELAKG